jgi:hypothetical protein
MLRGRRATFDGRRTAPCNRLRLAERSAIDRVAISNSTESAANRHHQPNALRRSRNSTRLGERRRSPDDIFEGTEQIQQLVIAMAISGLRIE